jgi:hypothetical protein
MPDILDTPKKEPDGLRKLFKQLIDTSDTAEKTRSDLLEKIAAKLVGHAKGEEAVFYPAFASVATTKTWAWSPRRSRNTGRWKRPCCRI